VCVGFKIIKYIFLLQNYFSFFFLNFVLFPCVLCLLYLCRKIFRKFVLICGHILIHLLSLSRFLSISLAGLFCFIFFLYDTYLINSRRVGRAS